MVRVTVLRVHVMVGLSARHVLVVVRLVLP